MEIRRDLWLPFLVFFLRLFLEAHISVGSDSIFANRSLSGNQTIVSAGGVFELGFFKPGNRSNYYIGIWYKKISVQTIVWVANREKPVSDIFSSVLTISNGNLVLFNESKLPIWSTNLNSTSSDSMRAELKDDGNLVLNDAFSNSTEPLWRSSDYPTDTWLPGSRLGHNKRTGEFQQLTSWKNLGNPAPGLFSLQLDPNGTNAYLLLWNRSIPYWTSGTWDGRLFSKIPEMIANNIYKFTYVTNENESYFTYSVNDPSITYRFVLDISGQVKHFRWLETPKQWTYFGARPIEQCDVLAFCGAFGICSKDSSPFCNCLTGFEERSTKDWYLGDYSGGCKRKTPLNCESGGRGGGERDGFVEMADVKLPENPISINAVNQRECESNCLKNCSCNTYAYDNGGCEYWTGNLLNTQLLPKGDASGKTLNVRLAASEIPSLKKGKGITAGAVAGMAVGATVLVLLFFVLVTWSKRNNGGTRTTIEGSLVSFGYRDLQKATKNFTERLGGGGFGSVYKGTLSDSTVVAVKKLEGFTQGEKQFRAEVSTIGAIQHVNLVRLRGFCSEVSNKMLVYDYMPNGSLNSHLSQEGNSVTLDWKTRYQIAVGTARGLTYLHEKCRDCIIHCDIKPENILLDSNFSPKLADFGLAKLMGREFSRVLTTMRGTVGYLAPEWIEGAAITAKADVFSYGMMLFEIISGRRNSETTENGEVKFFPTWAASVITGGGNVLSVLDSRLQNNVDLHELNRLCKVACWCIQDVESQRPSMGQVVQILEGGLDLNLPPIPRSLLLLTENQDNIVFFSESSSRRSFGERCNISTTSQAE